MRLSRWPSWRRCFGVQQDGRDALLIALKFIGAIEAGALMESIMVRAAGASRRHLLQRVTRIAVLVDVLGQDHRPVSVRSAELHLTCSFISRGFLCWCARLGSRRWIVAS